MIDGETGGAGSQRIADDFQIKILFFPGELDEGGEILGEDRLPFAIVVVGSDGLGEFPSPELIHLIYFIISTTKMTDRKLIIGLFRR